MDTRRFMKYLLVMGIFMMFIWTLFALLVLPLLPELIAGPLALLGIFSGLVMGAYTLVYFYEKGDEDEDG